MKLNIFNTLYFDSQILTNANYKFVRSVFPLLLLSFFQISCQQDAASSKTAKKKASEKKTLQQEKIFIKDQEYLVWRMDTLYWLESNVYAPIQESWCYNNAESCENSGRLYRWTAAMEACKLIGNEWRVPNMQEWQALASFFGGFYQYLEDEEVNNAVESNVALIEGGTSGMDHLLGGWRGSGGGFEAKNSSGYYWTATEKNETEAWCMVLYPRGGRLTFRPANKDLGFSCRCVRIRDINE